MSGFAQPTLRLSKTQYETIVGHCYDGLPNEACGLLAGPVSGTEPTGAVTAAVPCRNADESAVTYTVDSGELFRAERAAQKRGEELIGCWHSHTHTDPYPSPTDVRQAEWYPHWVYVIVSLRDEAPMLRAYRIRDGVISEISVALG
jgi:proteasome lid subunit RPN8/RPN11